MLFGMHDEQQGILHVVGPEQGITQPGMLIVGGDSHTSTHGAFGNLSFGIGASEVSARDRDADDLAAPAADDVHPHRRPARLRRQRQGRDPGDHRRGSGSAARLEHVIEYAGSTIARACRWNSA